MRDSMAYRRPEYIRRRLGMRGGWRRFKRYTLAAAIVIGALYLSGSCSCGSVSTAEPAGIERIVEGR